MAFIKNITDMEIIYYVACSLDNYIATLDGGVDWLSPFEKDNEDYGYSEFYQSIDAILMGRKTYQKVLESGKWPYIEKPCWVFSNKLQSVTTPNTVVTSDDPLQLVKNLSGEDKKRLWLVGGAQLAAAFRDQGLITQYIISIIPVLIGRGIPMMQASERHEKLELKYIKRFDNGLIQLFFKVKNE